MCAIPWHAKDAVQTGEISPDEGADIIVATLTIDEIRHEIQAGSFRHSLALLALTKVFDLWNGSTFSSDHHP